jgi:hypothetical protein
LIPLVPVNALEGDCFETQDRPKSNASNNHRVVAPLYLVPIWKRFEPGATVIIRKRAWFTDFNG